MEDSSKKSDFKTAYGAGKRTVLGLPRWRFYLLVILGIVVGNVVKGWLISRYSLPRSEACFLATVAVIVFGSVAGLVIAFLIAFDSRKNAP